MVFLFWNLNQKPLTDCLCELVRENNVDVVCLAEFDDDSNRLAGRLSVDSGHLYSTVNNLAARVVILSRLPTGSIRPVCDDGRMSLYRVTPIRDSEFCLGVTHLRSKMYDDEVDQLLLAERYAETVRKTESQLGHQRTVLVGDFNMNPFEPGMLAARSFHAVSARHVAGRRTRKVDGQDFAFLYNPMWKLFDDHPDRPGGTFFRNGSGPKELFWHILDQVLVRPDLIDCFEEDRLEVVTRSSTCSLVSSQGLPNANEFSDHLPILFSLQVI